MNFQKCVFCGAVIAVVGTNLYCNCGNHCYNPFNESYIRKPIQAYNQEIQKLTYNNIATSASGVINKNVNDSSYSNDEIFINRI